jgi:protein-S-isoprenylcysteine O-methyltransferase Ste14
MYGFPLTLYLLSGWLQSKFPELQVFSHSTGHLWHTLFGLEGDPHSGLLDLITTVLILGGLVLLGFAWGTLHKAQQSGALAKSGLYAVLRHPQYVAFILIMVGYLLTWPTLPTLAIFPIMVVVYVRLAHREERDARALHGEDYERYAAVTPRFLPRLRPLRMQSGQ